jgi:hypothetical protein
VGGDLPRTFKLWKDDALTPNVTVDLALDAVYLQEGGL